MLCNCFIDTIKHILFILFSSHSLMLHLETVNYICIKYTYISVSYCFLTILYGTKNLLVSLLYALVNSLAKLPQEC